MSAVDEAPRSAPDDPLAGLRVDAVVGPTASGKTALALELAGALGAEIVSLDSMLVYRGLDVGTAKPTAAERAAVPHHLIDLVDPRERYDVQRYLSDVGRVVGDLRARGVRPLFVGGTGFYLKALCHGLFDGPRPDPALRAALQARVAGEGSAALHRELARRDPESAARIHPNDAQRVVRALEVLEQTGRPLSALQREWRTASGAATAGRPRRLVGLRPPPDQLERRIVARTEAMLAGGWIDEVRAIEAGGGFGPTAAQALGYPEVRAHLAGEFDRAELARVVALRTRQFARRQRTWYRHFDDIVWLDPEAPDARERSRRALAGEPPE